MNITRDKLSQWFKNWAYEYREQKTKKHENWESRGQQPLPTSCANYVLKRTFTIRSRIFKPFGIDFFRLNHFHRCLNIFEFPLTVRSGEVEWACVSIIIIYSRECCLNKMIYLFGLLDCLRCFRESEAMVGPQKTVRGVPVVDGHATLFKPLSSGRHLYYYYSVTPSYIHGVVMDRARIVSHSCNHNNIYCAVPTSLNLYFIR